MVRSFRNLVLVLAAAGLTLCAGAVFAQAAPSVVPVNISPVGPAAGGLQTMATYQATGAGAANGYYTRPVLVSNNTLGALGRGLLRRAAPVAAMMAAIEAAGWVIDELTGQVLTGPPPPSEVAPGDYYWKNTVNAAYTFASGSASAAFIAQHYNATVVTAVLNCGATSSNGVTPCYARIQLPSGSQINVGNNQYSNLTSSPIPLTGPHSQPQAVPDAQVGQVVANNPALAAQALRNPDGSVNRNPDVMAAAQALAQELAAANPSPDPTAEWDTGYQGGEPQPQSQTSLDFPNFCAWASKVCELADWLRDDQTEFDQDNEVPEISPDLSVSWNSGFSGGSCPAPMVVDAMGTDVEFSYQPLCDAASYIRPIVLAGAALLCVFIIGGFRRAS